MLTSTTDIQNYLNGNSVNLLPFVSAEWNYNLAYTPYATFSSAGKTLNATQMLIRSNWTAVGSNVNIINTSGGKVTDSFINPSAISLMVIPVDIISQASFQGQATVSIDKGVTDSKCYKVVFLAKSISNDLIDLSMQASNSSSPVSGSSSISLDNVDWQKVEFKIGQKPEDLSFGNLNLSFNMTNTTLSTLDNWGVIIDQVRIYEISYFDYCYGSLYTTDSPFSSFRPGESYVTSGNNLVPEVTRTVLNVNQGWNNAMPCSPIVYSPRLAFSSSKSQLFKNGLPSSFSQYKYYVSEKTSGSTSVGALYDNLLSTNKIVLKFNISQSKPDNIIVNLTNTVTGSVTAVNVPSSWISNAGVCVLYWDGSVWTNTKWAWNPGGNSGMPYIDNSGNISQYLSGNIVAGYQNIDQIFITQISSTATSNYNKFGVGSDTNLELRRLHLIEVSPRLELDMSSFVVSFDVKKELDRGNSPLPVSAMSANSAVINFSNIPLSGVGNAPISIFSNNGTVTPLNGLLVKNVKFYTAYYLPTKSNTVIPAGIFYADTWDNRDMSNTVINCFDIMKFLQSLPTQDYVSENQSALTVFSNLLDLTGFTDYNYDELYTATTDNTQKIDLSFFYSNASNKTLYNILQETFLAYQVGCYIDEYGVMRFKSLQNILTNYTSSQSFSDYNIVLDSYNEAVSAKIGKVLMRYRAPYLKNSVDTNGTNGNNATTSMFHSAPDIIYREPNEEVVPFNLLNESMGTASQNYYSTSPASFNNLFLTTTLDHKGFCFIEDEIISSGNLEVILKGYPDGNTQKYSVASTDELNFYKGIFNDTYGPSSFSVEFTGRHMDVKRGLFGTKSKPHLIMDNSNGTYGSKFITRRLSGASLLDTANPNIRAGMIQSPATNNAKTLVQANSQDQGYSTYSAKFRFPTAPEELYGGIFFGLNGTSSMTSNCYFIEIGKQTLAATKTTTYQLKFYYINSSGVKSDLLGGSIDITNSLKGDFDNEPFDALYESIMGGWINLKFINVPGKRAIYVNKKRYLLDRETQNLSTTGKYLYSSKWKNDTSTTNSTTSSLIPSSLSGTNFGFFSYSGIAANTSMELLEVYATETPLDEQVSYFFQTREFLNAMVSGFNVQEKSFFAQSTPQLFGINYYDVQLSLSPSLGVDIFKASYEFAYVPNGVAGDVKTLRIDDNHLSYSNILTTGFRAKFAIANNSNISVFTKTNSGAKSFTDFELLLSSPNVILLTPQMTVEKVVTPQIINDVIELQSDWIQSKKSAESILKVVANASDAFSRDVSIGVFGNPLVQVGDVVTLSYSLKNISNLAFFVKSVDQTFDGTGLTTTLILNQITFNSGSKFSKGSNYPATNALWQTPTVSSISPSSGPDIGGTDIVISGTNFGTTPSVVIGNINATIVSSTSTSITVTTPLSIVDGPVDIFVVSNGLSSSTNVNSKFIYIKTEPQIQIVSGLTAVLGAYNSTFNAYPVTITWSVGSESGKQYDLYDLNTLGTDGYTNGWNSISDTGSTHTYTTAPLYSPGITYTVTLTPRYSLSTTPGAAVSTTFVAVPVAIISGGNGINPPNSASVTYSAVQKAGLYDITWNYIKGSGSNEVMCFVDGIGGGNNKGKSTSNQLTITGISAGSHTFYLYGYNTTTSTIGSTSTSFTFDPSTLISGSITGGVTILPAPVISNANFSVNSNLQVSLTVDIVKDSVNNPNEYDIYVSPSYITGNTNPDVNRVSLVGRTPVSGVYQSLPATYSPSSYQLGHSVSIYAVAVDTTGRLPKSPNSNYLSTTPVGVFTFPICTVSISNTSVISWTVASGGFVYDTFLVHYSDGNTAHDISDTIYNSSGSTWLARSDNRSISTDGVTFSDSKYSNGVQFSPGTTLTVTVIGKLPAPLGLQSVPFIASAPTPAAPAAGIAPLIIADLSLIPTKKFVWQNNLATDGTLPTEYIWELWSGTSTSGSLLSSGIKAYSASGYSVTTGSAAPLYFRARAVVGIGGSTLGPWGAIVWSTAMTYG